MRISVITTTKSKTKNIVRLAKSLYPFYDKLYEFIIVDAGTSDIYELVIDSFKFPKIVDGIGSTRGGGKNIGIKKATGDVIVFLDDDVEVTKDWLSELLKSLKHSDAVAGWSPNPNGKDLPRVSIDIEGQDITLPSCNIAYKKEVFSKVGFFDEGMVTAEDIDFNYRCIQNGFTIGYNPRMKVLHHHRSTFGGFAKQAFWNGYGRRQLNDKHPELRKSHQHGVKFKSLARLGFGFLGYIFGGIFI